MNALACGVATVSVIGYGAILIASIIISVYLLRIFFEACISTITTTYILCHTLPGSNFTCRKPLFYENYDEAMDDAPILAMNLYHGIIGLALLSLLFALIMACAAGSFTRRANYTTI